MTFADAGLGEASRLILQVSSKLAVPVLSIAGDEHRLYLAVPADVLTPHRFRARAGPFFRRFPAQVAGAPVEEFAVVGDMSISIDIIEASPEALASCAFAPEDADFGEQCPGCWPDAGECVDRYLDALGCAGEPPRTGAPASQPLQPAGSAIVLPLDVLPAWPVCP